ncbi:hypothetical protein ACFPYI_08620 [Halomarina salina]|uniref:DUF7344 domain-containing protein n=1 Tax=Halomarina salina TaxID=1872699 RepID=A0ABD5RMC5_9EURY|nr:hypothetical protein [Halomarina salina]
MREYEPGGISKNAAFEAVTTERRRVIVDILSEDDSEYELELLASEVATRMVDTSSMADETDYEQMEVALMHRDLPKLADEDIVSFDTTAQTVSRGAHITDVDPLV